MVLLICVQHLPFKAMFTQQYFASIFASQNQEWVQNMEEEQIFPLF